MSPRRPKIHPRRPKTTSRWPKTAREDPKGTPGGPPGDPNLWCPLRGSMSLAFSPFWAPDAARRPHSPPRSPQDGPRGPREARKTHPRLPQ
eukprot:6240099-Pyramimonas_sp.AAC.1